MPTIGFIVYGDGGTAIENRRFHIARSVGPDVLRHLGQMVFFCWHRPAGTFLFFATARADAIEIDDAHSSDYAVRLGNFRLLKQHATLHPKGWVGDGDTILSLSDTEAAELLTTGGEGPETWWATLAEAQAPLHPSDEAVTGSGRTAIKRLVLEAYRYRCAITGELPGYDESASDTLELVAIRPEREGGFFEPANLLPMCARARAAWERGLISVGLNGYLAISPFLGDGQLAGRLNPSGRLSVTEDAAAAPDPQAVLYHYLFVFQQFVDS